MSKILQNTSSLIDLITLISSAVTIFERYFAISVRRGVEVSCFFELIRKAAAATRTNLFGSDELER